MLKAWKILELTMAIYALQPFPEILEDNFWHEGWHAPQAST